MLKSEVEALRKRIEARKATGLSAAEYNAQQKAEAEQAKYDSALAAQIEIQEVVNEHLYRRRSSIRCIIRNGKAEMVEVVEPRRSRPEDYERRMFDMAKQAMREEEQLHDSEFMRDIGATE